MLLVPFLFPVHQSARLLTIQHYSLQCHQTCPIRSHIFCFCPCVCLTARSLDNRWISAAALKSDCWWFALASAYLDASVDICIHSHMGGPMPHASLLFGFLGLGLFYRKLQRNCSGAAILLCSGRFLNIGPIAAFSFLYHMFSMPWSPMWIHTSSLVRHILHNFVWVRFRSCFSCISIVPCDSIVARTIPFTSSSIARYCFILFSLFSKA